MAYKVDYSKDAIKDLKKLDTYTRKIIFAWIEKNLVGTKDPRHTGKALVANHLGKWRYRIGDYRILASIEDENISILVVNVGHRKNVY